MAYNAQAGGTPAYYPQVGAAGAGASSFQQYQPYQYPAHDAAPAAVYGHEDIQPEAEAAPVPVVARLGRLAGLAGAAASLALIAGVGIWSYELISRDISGVPVVRAVEGPMRVQPDNPGGEAADHQGLAVNAVAATGGAEAPADRLVLAPRDVALTEDDQPLAGLSQVETLAAPLPGVESAPAPTQEAFQQGQIDALVAELTTTETPLEPLAETVQRSCSCSGCRSCHCSARAAAAAAGRNGAGLGSGTAAHARRGTLAAPGPAPGPVCRRGGDGEARHRQGNSGS
jgi:hypothetical protein